MSEHKDHKSDDKFRPAHYKGKLPDGNMLESVTVIEAFFLTDAHLSQAFKYMSRAGSKKGESYTDDLTKAKFWIERAIEWGNKC